MTATAAKLRDVTGALRSRRYRRRQKANRFKAGVTVSTPDMCALAARLEAGAATAAEQYLAGRLIMALVSSA